MIKFLHIAILFCFFGCRHPESKEYERYKEATIVNETNTESIAESNSYKVIGIKDGDTFVVLIDGKEQVIRLEHIDCPEKKQPFGTKAKQFASDLCFGKYVQLKNKNKYDRYKRLISEIILNNGVNVNKELVSHGLAWHFKKYSKDNDYSELEITAKNNQIGIWSELNPTAPWDWRKNRQIARPITTENEGRWHNKRLAPFFCRRRNTEKTGAKRRPLCDMLHQKSSKVETTEIK